MMAELQTKFISLFIIAALLWLSGTVPAHARPLNGQLDWLVLYCRFTNSPSPTRSIAEFNTILSSTQGFKGFYDEASHGMIAFNFHPSTSWIDVPHDLAWARGRANPAQRMEIFDACVNAAAASGTIVPPEYFVAVVTTPGIETTGYFKRALLGIEMHVSGIVHEMGHGLGFEHSYSERPDHMPAMGNTHYEYGDPFDIMSLNSVFHTQGQWGPTGPRMNSYNLDRMGWIARDEAVNFGANGRTQSTYTLRPLYQTWPGGVRLVRIPFDPADPSHYYVVEMRQNTGLDAAFTMHRVLIYEVKPLPGKGYLQGFLLRVGTFKDAIQSLEANGVTIEINSIAPNGSSAVITVKGDIAKMCVPGFVPRNAGPSDNVCVPQASRDQALAENNSYFGLISRCRLPLVQRQAFANDRVCVTQERYEEVQKENAVARERNAAQAFRGLNACAAGYVWREAGTRDYVCVTPLIRDETLEENRLAPSRQVRLPFTNGYICAQGFVRRQAFLGDSVCAPESSRLRAIQDNDAAANRLLYR